MCSPALLVPPNFAIQVPTPSCSIAVADSFRRNVLLDASDPVSHAVQQMAPSVGWKLAQRDVPSFIGTTLTLALESGWLLKPSGTPAGCQNHLPHTKAMMKASYTFHRSLQGDRAQSCRMKSPAEHDSVKEHFFSPKSGRNSTLGYLPTRCGTCNPPLPT